MAFFLSLCNFNPLILCDFDVINATVFTKLFRVSIELLIHKVVVVRWVGF